MSPRQTHRSEAERTDATARAESGLLSFNLVDDPWIPVIWRDGKPDHVGLRKALTEAGRTRQIAASNPMDNVALLRFLLAALQWCKPELRDDERATLNHADGIPAEWLKENLGENGAPNPLFDLLGGSNGFMQAPSKASNKRPVADLFHELPGATNVEHLRHIRDYREGACPACISVGLARLPIAMTGKGAGKRPGINGDPPAYFMPVGGTLLETLKLNWPYPNIPGDKPCWLATVRRAKSPVGVMEGFTWTSRQFRIAGSGPKSGSCMVCGAPTECLVTCLHERNRPNGRDGLSRSATWRDPHVAYDRETKKVWRAEDAEKNLPGSSGQWRDWLPAVLGGDPTIQQPTGVVSAVSALKPGASLRVEIVGIVTRTDKSVECWRHVVAVPGEREGLARGTHHQAEALNDLDDLISRILDPHVDFKGKRLQAFKGRHPLTQIRNPDRRLPDSIRSALADRLPALESAMFGAARRVTAAGAGSDTPIPLSAELAASAQWKSLAAELAETTTAGSPLRRRQAHARARMALQGVVNARPKAVGGEATPTHRANTAADSTTQSGDEARARRRRSGNEPDRRLH